MNFGERSALYTRRILLPIVLLCLNPPNSLEQSPFRNPPRRRSHIQSCGQVRSRPPIQSPNQGRDERKVKRRKKNYPRDCAHQQSSDFVAETLAHALLLLNKNSDTSKDLQFCDTPYNHSSPKPPCAFLPSPSRIKFSPGFHPGIIPLMDIVFT